MAENRRYAQVTGGMIQSVLPLINWKTKKRIQYLDALTYQQQSICLAKTPFTTHQPPHGKLSYQRLDQQCSTSRAVCNIPATFDTKLPGCCNCSQEVGQKPITEPECGTCGNLCRQNACTIGHKCTNPGNGDTMVTLLWGEDKSNIKYKHWA